MGSDWRKFIYLSVAILLVNEFIVGWKINPSRDTSDPGVLPTVDDHKASDVANVNVSRQVDEESPVVVPPSVRDMGMCRMLPSIRKWHSFLRAPIIW